MSLQDIFAEQIRLNEKINPDLYKEISDPEIRRQRFLQFELALRQESAEAIDSLNWKWWKKDDDDWWIFFTFGYPCAPLLMYQPKTSLIYILKKMN